MEALAFGALAAITASVLFSTGLVLQSLEARTIPGEHSLRLSLIKRLLRHRRWVAGCLVMVAGFGFHVVGLLLAPLSIVQPSLTAGLVVLIVAGARHDAEPVHAREMLAVTAVALGIVGVTLTASQRTTLSAGPVRLALTLGPLAAVAIAPYALAVRNSRHGLLVGISATVGAGAAYSLTGLTTKLVSDRVAAGDWPGVVLWLAITASSAGLALLDQTTALQRRGVKEVGVVIYVMPVVLPVLLAEAALGEPGPSSPAVAAAFALSIASVCAGAVSLSGTPGPGPSRARS